MRNIQHARFMDPLGAIARDLYAGKTAYIDAIDTFVTIPDLFVIRNMYEPGRNDEYMRYVFRRRIPQLFAYENMREQDRVVMRSFFTRDMLPFLTRDEIRDILDAVTPPTTIVRKMMASSNSSDDEDCDV